MLCAGTRINDNGSVVFYNAFKISLMQPCLTQPRLKGRQQRMRVIFLLLVMLLISTCNLPPGMTGGGELAAAATGDASGDRLTPPVVILPQVTPQTLIPGAPEAGLTDAMNVMSGICFESAFDAAGQVFVLRSEAELSRLFDLADNSRLCRRAVTRGTFDFSSGQILVGTWSRGSGCTARHEVLAVDRDEANRRVTLRLRFITEGDCNYELVRPFWVRIGGVSDYAVDLTVETPPG